MSDTFASTSACVERLQREYAKHARLVLAVDYDGTLAPYPADSGSRHTETIKLVARCSRLGFHVVLYTASAPARYPEMRDFCAAHDIRVASINENPIPLPFGLHGKIYYNLLLDDRAGLGSALDTLSQFLSRIDPSFI